MRQVAIKIWKEGTVCQKHPLCELDVFGIMIAFLARSGTLSDSQKNVYRSHGGWV
jgi:hypothetical protein